MPRSYNSSLFFSFSHQNPARDFVPYSACNMASSSHPSRFEYSNNIWQIVQIVKFLIMQSYPTFY